MNRFHSSATITTITTVPFLNDTAEPEDDQTVLEVIPFITDGLDGGWFGKISTTLIILFGTFGNVMTVIILRRLRSGWSAMNVYLTALALSDTAMLYTGALPMWSRKVLDYDVYASHVVICKLAVWGMNLASISSAWLLVALTCAASRFRRLAPTASTSSAHVTKVSSSSSIQHVVCSSPTCSTGSGW